MKLSSMLPFRRAVGSLLLLATLSRASDGFYNTYCSSENTGSSYAAEYNIYNSMGSCTTLCQDDYAFAVLQWQDCWCSNYIPTDLANVSECDSPCPGYTTDQCGNQDLGLFGYVALSKAPLGTAGGSTPTHTTNVVQTTEIATTVTSKWTPPPTTTTETTTSSTSSYTEPAPSSTTSSNTLASSAPEQSSASSLRPTTSTPPASTVHTTTINGAPTTQTVTSTPAVVSSNPSTDQPQFQRKGVSSGAIAGIVIGALVGAAALILAAFFFWRRRKNGDSESGSSIRGAGAGGLRNPKRKGSVLSRTGLLGGAARPQSMSEMNYDNPYSTTGGDGVTQSNSVRHSIMFGGGGATGLDGVEAAGPLGTSSSAGGASGPTTDGSGNENRHSRPLVYDQRLNPSALFANFDNGSRVSMQDQQDYSRPLGVANPDLRYSFDSR